MASETLLSPKTAPSSPAPLPSFPQNAITGPKKAADTAMKNIQREQTQPSAPAPSLSSRVGMSVADELDSLLSEAFEEQVPTPDLVPPAQTRNPTPQTLELPTSILKLTFANLSDLIYDILTLPLIEQTHPSELKEGEIALLGERVNSCLQELNRFFEKMRKQEKTLRTWVETNQDFFNCHPMAASHYLSLYLEKSHLLAPHLDQVQLADWKKNYPQCVLMLKQNGLDAYVETEFPFEERLKDQVANVKKCYDNPQFLKELLNESENPFLPQLIFFRNLERQLKEHPQDRGIIDAWLQSETSKPGYQHFFFNTKERTFLPFAEDDPSGKEVKTLYESCLQRLNALGLGRYSEEILPPKLFAQRKSKFDESKDLYKKMGEGCLSVLRPLSEELRQMPAQPAAKEANRKTIETWFANLKARKTYDYPFFFVPMLLGQRVFLKGVLSDALLQELDLLYHFCKNQLLALGLNDYLRENPQQPTGGKKELTASKQFEKEIEFFNLLLQQDEKTLDAWLAENNPKYDYPLLWGTKRASKLEHYRESVGFGLRLQWQSQFAACQARLSAPALSVHLNTDQIPANASRQLRAFIDPQDPLLFMDFGTEPEGKYQVLLQEIEAAIQNPLAPSSLKPNKHLRYYLSKYPQIIEKLIPPNLLAQWKAAFSGVAETPPSLPAQADLQAVINFHMSLLRKSKEGTQSTLRWLDEQKASANYTHPFYQSLYWQTLAKTDDHPKIKLVADCHQKIVDWAYQAEQKQLLLETPPGSQGLCMLVHRLTEHLLKPSPKAVIVKLVPRMSPLLEKSGMVSYWTNTLINDAAFLCTSLIQAYSTIQENRPKADVLYFLNLHMQHGKSDFLSKGNVQKIAQLAPLLPPGLADQWQSAYDDCCAIIRKVGIPIEQYTDVPVSAFFSENKKGYQTQYEKQFDDVSAFFAVLEGEKDSNVKSKIQKTSRENPDLKPFWFAREIDDLLKGYNVIIVQKKLKEFRKTFQRIQAKLTRLGLQQALAEPAPVVQLQNFLIN